MISNPSHSGSPLPGPGQPSSIFVGFGFGAIQAGLFLYEAFKTNTFGRLVIAEVVPDAVRRVRESSGSYRVNIAHANGIEVATVGPIEIYDPSVEADRQALVAAIAQAQEIATAVPSVSFYRSDTLGSIHRLLAEGLSQKARQRGCRAVIYAAENHNHAAEILEEHVLEVLPTETRGPVRSRVRFLNTVIGKMSGVLTDPEETAGLAGVTQGDKRAFLVEEFNRILISRIRFPESQYPFGRGIAVFEEKDNLLPFEEAKLYGHNATHALAAYVAQLRGIPRISDMRPFPALMGFLREAFIEESGRSLIRKHRGVDALFTEAGYTHYVDDLLTRMTNPYLRDTTERVGRDPQRKLGWDDRLIGTIRLALSQGVRPWRYAIGAAAAFCCLHPELLTQPTSSLDALADNFWGPSVPALERNQVVHEVARGLASLKQWLSSGSVDTAPKDVGA